MITSPGIQFLNNTAHVKLWAPNGSKVSLISGEKNISLQKMDRGYWSIITKEITPYSRYQFAMDDQPPLPDPASRSQPNGVHDASEALDLSAYTWQCNNWQNPKLEQYILYELHTGTFSEQGTFEGIVDHIPHLVSLGITAIELMPVAAFPGCRNWGYDGVYPYAVQESYGGAFELMKLVDTCHIAGIAVILDVVYNHLGPEGNYLNNFGPYFTDQYKTPWGMGINVDHAGADGVREYVVQNVLMWFRDFKIDALRLDAVHAIKDYSAKHILTEIRAAVDTLMKQEGTTHYLIVECDLNDSKYIDPTSQCGYGMDAQWMDEFHHTLRVAAGQNKTGYYSDFNGINQLAKSYETAFIYDGLWSEERQRTFGGKALHNPGSQFIVFSQNHDQLGNRVLGERSSVLCSFEMQKLLAAAVMVSPFLPMLFMGEEWAETNPFLYFVSHADATLVEAVRRGRREEFKAFFEDRIGPDPQAEQSYESSKLQWHLSEDGKNKTMLHYYKSLIALRKSSPALNVANREGTTASAEAQSQVLTLIRTSLEHRLHCLLNFSSIAQICPSDFDGKLIFCSASTSFGGPTSAEIDTIKGDKLLLAPESIFIYQEHV